MLAFSCEPKARSPMLPEGRRRLGLHDRARRGGGAGRAVATDAAVIMERTPGASLVAGRPVAFSWPITPGQRLDADRVKQLQPQVAGAVSVRFEHTAAQDITYGLRQLTDVANKALSPGINDPTTANHALAHTSGLLCTMVAHNLGPWMLRDDDERVRVIMCRPRLNNLLELALAGPRRYGSADPEVLARQFTLLRELARSTGLPDHRHAIRGQFSRLTGTASEQHFDLAEQAWLTELDEQVDAALRGEWRPDDPQGVAPVENPA